MVRAVGRSSVTRPAHDLAEQRIGGITAPLMLLGHQLGSLAEYHGPLLPLRLDDCRAPELLLAVIAGFLPAAPSAAGRLPCFRQDQFIYPP